MTWMRTRQACASSGVTGGKLLIGLSCFFNEEDDRVDGVNRSSDDGINVERFSEEDSVVAINEEIASGLRKSACDEVPVLMEFSKGIRDCPAACGNVSLSGSGHLDPNRCSIGDGVESNVKLNSSKNARALSGEGVGSVSACVDCVAEFVATKSCHSDFA